MARTQATISWLKASHQAFQKYDAGMRQAAKVRQAALKEADATYWIMEKQASAVREAALDKAFEAYEAEKKQEEIKKRR